MQSYATEANKRSTAFWVDLVFAAVAGLIAALKAIAPAASILKLFTTWTAPTALLWLAVRETGLLSDDKEHRRTAVTIQDQFDLTLWKGQRWREGWNGVLCGKPVQQRVINDLALRYRGDPLNDGYWVDTSEISTNEAALLRIE